LYIDHGLIKSEMVRVSIYVMNIMMKIDKKECNVEK
jgi:hypothetical protein